MINLRTKRNPKFSIFSETESPSAPKDRNRSSLFVTMGNNNSSLPSVDGLTPEDIDRLNKRFKKLDLDHSGSIR